MLNNCPGQALALPLDDAEALLIEGWLSRPEADGLFQALHETIPWRQDSLNFGGRKVAVPRLQSWHGDADSRYGYSGLSLDPLPWTAQLRDLKARVEAAAGQSFNSVLLNLYRDGRDSVSWHSNNERELGPDPVIASLSLGASRRFELRRRDGGATQRCELSHGSLLLMGPGVQPRWRHRVPKQPEVSLPRINLTFRRIHV